MVRRTSKSPPPEVQRTSLRHRHPDYPRFKCGMQTIVRSDGKLQQRGKVRRKCTHCHKPLRRKDLV